VIDERIQILLVEDNAADVRLLREAMRDAQSLNDIQVATDGEQALVTMREGPGHASTTSRFDLVLLDLNLPRKGGLEVLAEIRRDPMLSLTPVIILTTSGAETDVRSAYGLGANCFVVKPVDFGNFRKVIVAIDQFWLGVARLPG